MKFQKAFYLFHYTKYWMYYMYFALFHGEINGLIVIAWFKTKFETLFGKSDTIKPVSTSFIALVNWFERTISEETLLWTWSSTIHQGQPENSWHWNWFKLKTSLILPVIAIPDKKYFFLKNPKRIGARYLILQGVFFKALKVPILSKFP